MTRQLKRILILALAAMMTLGVLCGTAYAGNDNSCGQGLTWKLNKGILTISGAGAMDDYNMRSSRWGGDYTKIEKVVVSEGVTHIGAYAFFNCSYLTSVTIADSVTSIGNNAFQSCNVLETLSIPNQVQTIGTYAFNNCWCLTGVAIPEGITRIESNTFSYCNNLEQITIPDSVTYIGDGAFNNCAKLNSITYNGAQAEWESISIGSNNTGLTGASINCLTADGGSCGTDVRWSLSNDGELTISGSGAMSSFSTADDVPWKSHASSIHSVSIGDEVTNIEDFAFANCGELASVDLPSSLNAIGASAFYSCYGLKDISKIQHLLFKCFVRKRSPGICCFTVFFACRCLCYFRRCANCFRLKMVRIIIANPDRGHFTVIRVPGIARFTPTVFRFSVVEEISTV